MLTPIGQLTGFVAIETPSVKFGPATYSCKMAFTGTEAKKMKEAIDMIMLDSKAKSGSKGSANPPYKVEDKQLIVSFKQKAEIKSRAGKVYEMTVKVYDAKGQPVNEVLGMGSGTECRISYSPYMWTVPSLGGAGATLQLEMIQILKLVKYEGGGGGNPFGEVEGDFVIETKTNPFDAPAELEEEDGDF